MTALTSRLRSDLVETSSYHRVLVDVTLREYLRLQQRHAALLEVRGDRAGDVSAFVAVHRHFRRQTPLPRAFTPSQRLKPNSITLASSKLAPNMFGASSELVRSWLRTCSELVRS